MPKQVFKIKEFHGGINSDSDPRDLREGQSPTMVDCSIDSVGRLKLMGSTSETDGSGNSFTHTPLSTKNKGLFVMSSDRQFDGGSADETLIFSYDSGDNKVDGKDSEGWDANLINPAQAIDPLYYSADGVLRVGDKNLSAKTRWFGYVTDERFEGMNADSGSIGWLDANQELAKPSSGKCLMSTPHSASDSNGVNSTDSEYIGDVIDNSGTDVAVHSAVNLRVGVQIIDVFPNTTSSWTYGFSTGADNTDLYPLFGDNNVKVTGSSTSDNDTVSDSVDNFSVTEDQSVVFGFFISTAELAKLQQINITMSTFEWDFTADQLVADCWNLLVCGANNVSVLGSGGLGTTMSAWAMTVLQKTGNTGNDAPDFYLSGPVLCSNGGALGVDSFQPGSHTFYHTYLYDDSKQESLPFLFDDVDTGSAPNNRNEINIVGSPILFSFDAYICSNVGAGNAYGFNKRLTGSRLYWKNQENDNYFLIGELDFVDKGFKWTPESDTLAYDMANTSNTATPMLSKTAIVKNIDPVASNIVDTFKIINGFSSEVTSLEAKYKTAVVHGRRAYVGNIKQDSKTHPDRMLKSQVNKFDTFPKGHGIIDVVIRDGEDIVKLEAYADRILQFKKNSLYIINVSDNIEFLEDTYRNKGCSFDYHTTKTDQGIAWFNIHGVYFYDGQKVHNLLEKGGIRIINETDWEAFITDGEDGSSDDADMGSAMIGYIPKKRHILIKNENNDVFIFDLILQAWTKGSGRLSETTHMTNFALDANQDLFYIDSTDTDINTWQTSAQSSAGFVYQTPDIDFGEPGVRKKIHKVYITYKTGGTTNVQVKYDVDGETSFDKIFKDGTSFSSNELSNAGSGGWTQATLAPNTSSEANNIYSFALKFTTDGTVPSTFEINDISIIYRMKHIK